MTGIARPPGVRRWAAARGRDGFGTRGLRRPCRACRHRGGVFVRGAAFVESLLAVPIVLLLGLGALQWALLLHARTALEFALVEAARAGSVGQARPEAIEAGLARGLMPYWHGIDVPGEWASAIATAALRLREGQAAGWIVWRQISPTIESFGDWGEPARDAFGHPMPGTIEIPNDNLQWADLRQPASGVVAMRGDEPIGTRSEQTLNDANLLKLELRYGVPMTVPLVGRIAVWMMRIVDGCAAPSARTLGALDLGTPAASAAPRAWTCAMYLAPDASGSAVPRWPVLAGATMRMQSPARRSAMTPARTQSAVRAASSFAAPSGGVQSRPSAEPAASTDAASGGPAVSRTSIGAAHDGSLVRGEGAWLGIGGERTFSVPGACT